MKIINFQFVEHVEQFNFYKYNEFEFFIKKYRIDQQIIEDLTSSIFIFNFF